MITIIALLSPKSVNTVILIGVYALDDTVFVLLLSVLLSVQILSLDIECNEDINMLLGYIHRRFC